MPSKKIELEMNDFQLSLIANYIASPKEKWDHLGAIVDSYNQAILDIEIRLEEFKKNAGEKRVSNNLQIIKQLEGKCDKLRRNIAYYDKLAGIYEGIDKAYFLVDSEILNLYRKINVEGVSQKSILIDTGYSSRYITNCFNKMINMVYCGLNKEKLLEIELFLTNAIK